jgi:phosphoribosylanthranilate isomerase
VADAPLVKICGLTREEDVDSAIELGADLVGFVVVTDSARGVTLDRARELAGHAAGRARTVAVYAGAEPESRDGFDMVQVYGVPAATEHTIVGCREEEPPPLPEGVPVLLDLARGSRPDTAVLAAHWQRAAGVRAPVMLAGALDPGNVGPAVQAVRPWAVDTARGVECAPGIKDRSLIAAFITAAKEAP